MDRIRLKNARFVLLPFDILIGMLMGIYGYTLSGGIVSLGHVSKVISLLSFSLIIIQFLQLKYVNVKLISSVGAFLLGCNFFSFGEFYVCFFGHEELLVYPTWFSYNLDIKYQTGFYMLAAIQCAFSGIFAYSIFSKKNVRITTVKKDLTDTQWLKIGFVFLLIGLPCRLYWDYLNILLGSSNNMYSGGASVSGLLDDFQILFIPGLICVLHGLRKNKALVISIIGVVMAMEVLVMASSGNRRLYITSLVGLFFYFFYEYPWKKHAKWKIVLFAILGITVLNYLELIRKYRFLGLGANFFSAISFSDLFSFDFLWDSLAEFGLTSHAIYYDFLYITKFSDLYLGKTFLTAIVYIVPIGFIINVNKQAASIIERLSGSAVGGSMINDLFVNWGWAGLFVAPFVGYFIARLGYRNVERGKINYENIYMFFVFPMILGYARGDIFEVLRPAAYIYILFSLCTKLLWPPHIVDVDKELDLELRR